MNEFDILQAAAAGMDAQRSALDVAARNVAAAQATTSADGFERLVPRFALAPDVDGADWPPATDPDGQFGPGQGFDPGQRFSSDRRFDPDGSGIDDDEAAAEPPIRYLGAVPERGTSVDAITEMVSVLSAQRAYESDASVFDIGKRLAERTVDLGRLS